MRLKLHIGSGKTGTTSIQKTLHYNREFLAQHGVLYLSLGNQENHNLLAVGFRGENQPQRRMLKRYGTNRNVMSAFRDAWLDVKNQAEQKDFHTVLLSGEDFFVPSANRMDSEHIHNIFPKVTNVDVVAYLRRPSAHYTSRIQQHLKAAHTIPAPVRTDYAAHLDGWQNVGDLHLYEFNKALLYKEDVVHDFWHRVLCNVPLPEMAVSIRENESLSAEGLYVMQYFRRHRYPDRDNHIFRDSDKLVRLIRLIESSNDRNVLFTRLKLQEHISNHIDFSTEDNSVLKEKFGFQYEFLKHEQPKNCSFSPDKDRPLSVQDLVSVDLQKVDLLIDYLRTDRRIPMLTRWVMGRKLQLCMQH
ncbi:MAG: hypothetical protein HKP56_06565 [Anderseniella sp.]|nr:hypothetical protein [Anderseniella sp.]